MRYIVKWRESCTVLYQYDGIVEADSEEEAKELVKNGIAEVIDSCEIDSYDGELIEIRDIYEDLDYDENE